MPPCSFIPDILNHWLRSVSIRHVKQQGQFLATSVSHPNGFGTNTKNNRYPGTCGRSIRTWFLRVLRIKHETIYLWCLMIWQHRSSWWVHVFSTPQNATFGIGCWIKNIIDDINWLYAYWDNEIGVEVVANCNRPVQRARVQLFFWTWKKKLAPKHCV